MMSRPLFKAPPTLPHRRGFSLSAHFLVSVRLLFKLKPFPHPHTRRASPWSGSTLVTEQVRHLAETQSHSPQSSSPNPGDLILFNSLSVSSGVPICAGPAFIPYTWDYPQRRLAASGGGLGILLQYFSLSFQTRQGTFPLLPFHFLVQALPPSGPAAAGPQRRSPGWARISAYRHVKIQGGGLHSTCCVELLAAEIRRAGRTEGGVLALVLWQRGRSESELRRGTAKAVLPQSPDSLRLHSLFFQNVYIFRATQQRLPAEDLQRPHKAASTQ